MTLLAPFPYFGGKRDVAGAVWARFGSPKQYIEPFAGSLAVLLRKPGAPCSLEVIGDANGFIANFWRAVRHQPAAVAEWADYPVSHIDIGARHVWLQDRRAMLAEALLDADWPGDAKVAGWWLWGQCCWIGSGWCDWWRTAPVNNESKVPFVSTAGLGVQAIGQVPFVGNAGRGITGIGAADAAVADGYITSAGRVAHVWLHKLAARLDRVRIIHGDWDRCLNHHYGGDNTAVFLDPPYTGFEAPYGAQPIAQAVAEWARANPALRIALCGHIGEHDMPGWDVFQWSRSGNTYGGSGTKDSECIWFSPGCLPAVQAQRDMFDL